VAITDPERLLEKMGSKLSKRRILATVLGLKMAPRDDVTSKQIGPPIPMDAAGTESSIVCAGGVGFVEAPEADKKAILKFWRTTPYAPDVYEYTEGTKPPLKVRPRRENEWRFGDKEN
jgi:hypothetical protein